jgi:alpha-ketoglutarate-dependent 2,4-dichlorophenoxyacetate dioxygenase
MSLSFRPFHPGFVAEVGGIDVRQPPASETVAELAAALDRYAVLVFPGQAIDDDQQLAFGRCFGPLESATFIHLKDRDQQRRHRQINYVSNLDPEGQLLPSDNRVRMYQLANRLWHTDSSFKAIAGRYSLLHARIVPPEGGETEFADLRAAYDALPEAMKAKLEGLLAPHSLLYSNRQPRPPRLLGGGAGGDAARAPASGPPAHRLQA